MNTKAQIVALLVSVSIATAYAADWPGYMGPRRDGTSTEKGLLRTWPTEGPKVLWTAPLGIGFGGPAVSRGKVYLLDRDDKVGDILRVYDFATGKELWNFAYDAAGTVRVSRLALDAHGGREHRLHCRSARRPAGDRHQHAQAAVAEEHLEGLRGRRRVHSLRAAWGRNAGAAAWDSGGCATGSAGTDRQVRRLGRPALPQLPRAHKAERLRGHPAGSAVVRRLALMDSAAAPRRFPCGASPRTRSSTAAW